MSYLQLTNVPVERKNKVYSTFTHSSKKGRLSFDEVVEAYLNFAYGQLKKGYHAKAFRLFQMILAKDPNNTRAWYGLAKAAGNWWQAREVLKEMEQAQPNNVFLRMVLYVVEGHCQEYQDFQAELRAVLEAQLKQRQPVPEKKPTRIGAGQVGSILLTVGYLKPQELDQALTLQKMLARYGEHQLLGQLLVEAGYVTQQQLGEVLEIQHLHTAD